MGETKTGIEGELYLYNGTVDWSGTISAPGTRAAFVEGVTFSWDRERVDVWDRGTFSHWKAGRGAGEVTIPQAYVDNHVDIITPLDATVNGSTAPRVQGEIRVYGTAGALDHTIQLNDMFLKHYERNEPEGADKVTWSMGFDIAEEPVHSTSSRLG